MVTACGQLVKQRCI